MHGHEGCFDTFKMACIRSGHLTNIRAALKIYKVYQHLGEKTYDVYGPKDDIRPENEGHLGTYDACCKYEARTKALVAKYKLDWADL